MLLGTGFRVTRHLLIFSNLCNDSLFYLLTFSSEIAGGGSLLITAYYAFERMVAMHYVDTYERQFKTNNLGLSFIFASVTGILANHGLCYLDVLPGSYGFLFMYATYVIGVVLSFFVRLYFVCKRKYQMVLKTRYVTVEKRYQTMSNYKTSILFLYLSPYKCVTSSFVVIWYNVMIDGAPPEGQYINAFFLFFIFQAQIFVQMWLTLLAEPTLRSVVKSFLKRSGTRVTPVRNSFGERMSFPIEQENEIYFRQLRDAWQ
ncbi:unnamed protein product, partial [Mesorhabditis spiculigera]